MDSEQPSFSTSVANHCRTRASSSVRQRRAIPVSRGLLGSVRLVEWLVGEVGCTYFPYGWAEPHLHVSCIVSHSRSGLILRPDVGGREEVDSCRIERVAFVRNRMLIDVFLTIVDAIVW